MGPPEEPDESDCCGSGCDPCVFDAYRRELALYESRAAEEGAGAGAAEDVLSPHRYVEFRVASTERRGGRAVVVFEHCRGDGAPRALRYAPGQHLIARVEVPVGGGVERRSRPYSPTRPPAGAPADSFRVFVAIREGGAVSTRLAGLAVGDVAEWRGPFGARRYERGASALALLVCQGVAAAPALSVAREILDDESDEVRVSMLCCCRSLDDAILRDELREAARSWNFSYEMFCPEPARSASPPKYGEPVAERRLRPDDVRSRIAEAGGDAQVLICGSPAFMDCYARAAADCGVEERLVRRFR